MAWDVPITVDGKTYPVRFEGEKEPSEKDIQFAVDQITDPARGQSTVEGITSNVEQGFQKGLTQTFVTGPGAVMSAMGADDNPLLKTGREIEAGIEADSPVSRENQQKFVVKAGGAVGQAASMVVTAPLAGAGTTAKAASWAMKARQIALMGGLAGAASGEEEATRLGVTDPLKKAGLILGYGAVEALSERLGGYGVESGLSRVLRGQGVGTGIIKGAVVEGFEEVGAGVPQRALSKMLAQEDPQHPGFTAQGQPIYHPADVGMMMEEFALGATAGGVVVGVTNVFDRMTPQQRLDSQNVANLPDDQRAQTFDQLQAVSREEASAVAAAEKAGVTDPQTLSALRVGFDGRRTNILAQGNEKVATEYAPGWEERERATLAHTGEETDAFFQNGQWVTSSAMDLTGQPVFEPAPNAAELEAARQEWIKTGQMPEGMQPLASTTSVAPTPETVPQTPPSVTPKAESVAPEVPVVPAEVESPAPQPAEAVAPVQPVDDLTRVQQQYPNSPELAERVAVAESPAAVQAILTEAEPRAQLVEELATLPPVALADRLREADIDEVTVAELTQGNLDFKTAGDLISRPVISRVTVEEPQAEPPPASIDAAPAESATTARVQPDEFESRLRQTIISENLRGWTDKDVQAAVAFHQSKDTGSLPSQVKRSVVGRIELGMQTPAERRAQEAQERVAALQTVNDVRADLQRARQTTDPIKATDPDLVKWADGVVEEGEVNAGLNPRLLAAHAVRAANWIVTNGQNFVRWSGEQISRFGRAIASHLRRIWDSGRAMLMADDSLPEVERETIPYQDRPVPASQRVEQTSKAVSESALVEGYRQLPDAEFRRETPAQLAKYLWDGLRLRAEGSGEAGTLLAGMLEVDLGRPFQTTAEREQALAEAYLAAGRDSAEAARLANQVLRMAVERQQGPLSEERAGMFDGQPMWRAQVTASLDQFLADAHRDVFGRDVRLLIEKAGEALAEKRPAAAMAEAEAGLMARQAARDAETVIWPAGRAMAAERQQANPYSSGLWEAVQAMQTNEGLLFVRTAMEARGSTDIAEGASFGVMPDGRRVIVTDQVHVTLADRRLAEKSGTSAAEEALKRVVAQAQASKPSLTRAQTGDVLQAMQSAAEWPSFVDDLWRGHRIELEQMVADGVGEARAQNAGTNRFIYNDQARALRESDRQQAATAWLAETFGPQIGRVLGGEQELSTLSGEEEPAWLVRQTLAPYVRDNPLRFSTEQKGEPRRRARVLRTGISAAARERARRGVLPILPGAANAWGGSREELNAYLRANAELQRQWKDQWLARPENRGKSETQATEAFEGFVDFGLDGQQGFTLGDRTYIIDDQVQVTEDYPTDELAARQVFIHEDTHEVVDHARSISPEVNRKWEAYRSEVPAAELDALVPLYPWMANWRGDQALHDEIFHEWMAKKISQIEYRGQPAADTLLGRILNWLRGLVRKFIGTDATPSDLQLLAFIDGLREARFRERGQQFARGVRFSGADQQGDMSQRQTMAQMSSEPGDQSRRRYNPRRAASLAESVAAEKEQKRFVQMLGETTDNVRLVQSLAPMIEFANAELGGLGGEEPEVNDENTAKVWSVVKALLTQKTFASRYIERFQRDYPQRDPLTGESLHAGDAAGSILALKAADYAVQLAAQGNSQMYEALVPYLNDVAVGGFATRSGSGRILQASQVASGPASFTQSLKLTLAAMNDVVREKIGDKGFEEMAASVDTTKNAELDNYVRTQAAEAVAETAAGAEILDDLGKVTEETESEGYYQRVLDSGVLDAETVALELERDRRMRRLDHLLQLQKGMQARAASAARPSMAQDDQALLSDPDAMQRAIDEEVAAIKQIIGKINRQPQSPDSKKKRRARNDLAPLAKKRLTSDEQGKKLIERYEERNQRVKRVKEPWRATFDQQVREPQTESQFVQAMEGHGMSAQTAADLYRVAEDIRRESEAAARQRELGSYYDQIEREEKREAALQEKLATRKSKADAQALNKSISESEREVLAQQKAEKEREEKRKADLRRYYDEVDRAEKKEAALQTKLAEARAKSQTKAENRAIAAELERQQKEAAAELREARAVVARYQRVIDTPVTDAPRKKSDKRTFVSALVRIITRAPLSQQGNPVWRQQTVENAMIVSGMSPQQAEKTARKLLKLIDPIILKGQEISGLKAMKAIKGLQKINHLKLGAAIRTSGIDPLNPNPAIRAIAEQMGFKGLTPAQFQRLAQLDELANKSLRHGAAKAFSQMEDILFTVRPGKGWSEIIAQYMRNNALAGLSVFQLNTLHPVYIILRRAVTEALTTFTSTAVNRARTGKGSVAFGNQFQLLVNAFQGFLDEARFTFKNNAYAHHALEMLNTSHQLLGEWRKANDILTGKTEGNKLKAVGQWVLYSTDIVRRILATADQTWGATLQTFVMENEAMRVLIERGDLSKAAAASMIQAAHAEGDRIFQLSIKRGDEPLLASMNRKDAVLESLSQVVISATGDREAGDQLAETGSKEFQMELGNRASESSPVWDLGNFIFEALKKASNAVKSVNEPLGLMMVGFVSVPANIANRSLYFSPLGIARALYRMKKGDATKHYQETMKTDAQARMRLMEGIIGTLGLVLLAALTGGSDDDKDGLVVTGDGPSNRGVREALMKTGWKPYHLGWRQGGKWVAAIPYTRGGFDHLALPLTALGAADDMRLNGLKPSESDAKFASAYGTESWQNYAHLAGVYGSTYWADVWKQARFFGSKNLSGSMPTSSSEPALVSTAAWASSSFVPFSGMVKSITRIATGTLDKSSVESALLAQVPFAYPIWRATGGQEKPALNYLGDPVYANPKGEISNFVSRLEYEGLPLFLGDGTAENDDVYKFIVKHGTSPSQPNRGDLESKNGFMFDETWRAYLILRGGLIKTDLRRKMPRMEKMKSEDLESAMSDISRSATLTAKKKMGLK